MMDGNNPVLDPHESNVCSYTRHFPVVFETARGSWITSADGRRFLDLLTGAGSLNYGHNNESIMAQVSAYIAAGGIINSLDLQTTERLKFLKEFRTTILEPRGIDYKVQFTGPTGTNAVEAAIKLARKVTGRATLGAFTNGFHGMSLGSLSATASPGPRNAAGTALGQVVFFPYDGYFGPDVNTLDYIGAMLKPGSGVDLPAALILEMVQGEGGLACASSHWIQGLAELCRSRGILLIVDDIQAGCGRTGRFFSFEEFGIVPDMVTLSKSLSGFGTPFSLVLMRPELDTWQPGEHTGTFRGNNLAFVGATAALRSFWKDDVLHRGIIEMSRTFRRGLTDLAAEFEDGFMVKGRGLILGLEFREPGCAIAMSRKLFERGIIAETCGIESRVLKFLPPLNISTVDIAFALETIGSLVPLVLGRTARARETVPSFGRSRLPAFELDS